MIDPRLQEKGYDDLSNATDDATPGSNTPESPGGSEEISIKGDSPSSSAIGTTGD